VAAFTRRLLLADLKRKFSVPLKPNQVVLGFCAATPVARMLAGPGYCTGIPGVAGAGPASLPVTHDHHGAIEADHRGGGQEGQ
jgi:hypothetical protein